MNNMRNPSKCSQITASVYDPRRDASMLQGFDSAINCKTFGDASKIDNHRPAKPNSAIIFENDVTPVSATGEPVMSLRKVIPFHKFSGNRDIENAIASA